MIIYRNESLDPYFNLASEEYLLNNSSGDVFMLWRNAESVIIGKNQNAYAELDLEYVREHGIKVVRRLTGGGAVFHDTGNVNFTFIVPEEGSSTLDFQRFTLPIIEALKALGIEDVCLSGRNDILVNGHKVSGNAQTVYNKKILHHGTLLYSADLSRLAGALKVDEEKIKSKGIDSVRARVCNISDCLEFKMNTQDFISYIENHIAKQAGCTFCNFAEDEIKEIQKLADNKYSTWEWNYGKSKLYQTVKKKRFSIGCVQAELSLDSGRISDIKIRGDFFGVEDIALLENALTGVRFEYADVKSALADFGGVGRCVMALTDDEFAGLLFENHLKEIGE